MATYGIGVQNRYSAFLDDDDGFALVAGGAGPKRPDYTNNSATVNKQKVAATPVVHHHQQQQQQNSTKFGNTKAINGRNVNQTQHQRGSQLNGEPQNKPIDGKRQRAGQQQLPRQQHSHQQGANNFVQTPRQPAIGGTNNGKQGNLSNQENTTTNHNNKRFVRTNNAINSNQHHQTNVSHSSNNNYHQHQQQQPNKENNDLSHHQASGKFSRNIINNNHSSGHRSQGNNNRRQFHHDDKRVANAQSDDGQAGGSLGVGLGEEEKRRRQQKRALDMKHKDPEKRDSRRQQQHPISTNEHPKQQPEQAHSELDASKSPKNRRQVAGGEGGGRGIQEDAARGLRGAAGNRGGGSRGRGRRNDKSTTEAEGIEPRDGQQQTNPRVPRNGATDGRPQRNRNGFGAGSKGSRGSRGDDQGKFARDSNRQKPIPNFSDKLDFPSLAS